MALGITIVMFTRNGVHDLHRYLGVDRASGPLRSTSHCRQGPTQEASTAPSPLCDHGFRPWRNYNLFVRCAVLFAGPSLYSIALERRRGGHNAIGLPVAGAISARLEHAAEIRRQAGHLVCRFHFDDRHAGPGPDRHIHRRQPFPASEPWLSPLSVTIPLSRAV